MKLDESLQVYFGSITSIIKLIILYILTKIYGIFGYTFLFLCIKIYQIIINKIYNLFPISFSNQINILRHIFSSYIKIKEAIINDNLYQDFENIIEQIKTKIDIINDKNNFLRILTYKLNNYYFRNLNKFEIEKCIIKSEDDLRDKLMKKINIKNEPLFQIFISNNKKNKNRIILKYTHLTPEIFCETFIKAVKGEHIYNINHPSKILVLIFEFILFPIQIILEIIIIILFYIHD